MKKIVIILILFISTLNANSQDYSDLFTTYRSVYTPRPVYVTPLPNVIDNSITIIDNSYSSTLPTTPTITCTNSQKQSGQVVMYDNSNNKSQLVDAEVLFKNFSNNTASITITKLKLDGKWYPMNIQVTRLSSLLDSMSGDDRNSLLELMKNYNFIAEEEGLTFLF